MISEGVNYKKKKKKLKKHELSPAEKRGHTSEGSARCSEPGVGHDTTHMPWGRPTQAEMELPQQKLGWLLNRLAVVKAGGWECTAGIECKGVLLPLTCSVTHPGELSQERQRMLPAWLERSQLPQEMLTYTWDAAPGNGEPELHRVQHSCGVPRWTSGKFPLFPAFPFLFLQGQQGQGRQHGALVILFYSPGVL